MATKVASIYVVGVKTTTRWVDRLVVELYSDAGLGNRVGLRTSECVWDGTYNIQKNLITFDGLITGNQYWVKAGFSVPVTGTITYGTAFPVTANDTNAPACTYSSATLTQTPAGVNVEVFPGSIPSDIDHFEATWTTNTSTAPPNTEPAKIPRLTILGGGINFFCGAKPNDAVRVYMRAVDTTGNVQAWAQVGVSTNTPTLTNVQDAIVWTGTSAGGGGNNYDYRQIIAGSYPLASGDKLEYDIFIEPTSPQSFFGVDFMYAAGPTTLRGTGLTDQNGLGVTPTADLSSKARGQWYHRIIDLTTLAGQTVSSVAIACEGDTAGNYLAKFANIRVLNSSGAIKYQWFSTSQAFGSMWGLPVWTSGAGSNLYSNVKTYTTDLASGAVNLDDHVTDGTVNYKPVYDGTNPLPTSDVYNSSFEIFPSTQTIADGWTAYETFGPGWSTARSTSPKLGSLAQSLTNNAASGGTSIASRPIAVKEGVRYRFGAWAKSSIANPGSMYLRCNWYTSDTDFSAGGRSGTPIDIAAASGPTAANTYQYFEGEVTIPAGVKYVRLALYNWSGAAISTITFDLVVFTPSVPTGNILSDGTYNTPNYHKSAVRRLAPNTQGSAALATTGGTWQTIGSFVLVFPSLAGGYKGTLTIKKNANGGTFWAQSGRIKIGSALSSPISHDDATFGLNAHTASGTVTVTTALSGSVTVEIQNWVDTDYGGTWTCQFAQNEYVDQDPDNVL
jgi:hypothetical protein